MSWLKILTIISCRWNITNIPHPFTNQPAISQVYESVGGQASQHSGDGYTHTSWPAVIHPAPPCSWHVISILNLNFPACFQHANLHPKPELATQLLLECRLQVMSRPSMLRCASGSSSLASCHAKIPLTEKKRGWQLDSEQTCVGLANAVILETILTPTLLHTRHIRMQLHFRRGEGRLS